MFANGLPGTTGSGAKDGTENIVQLNNAPDRQLPGRAAG